MDRKNTTDLLAKTNRTATLDAYHKINSRVHFGLRLIETMFLKQQTNNSEFKSFILCTLRSSAQLQKVWQ